MPSAPRLVNISTEPQVQMRARVVWDRRQGFGHFASAAVKAAIGSVTNEVCAVDHVRARRSNKRVDIVGIGGERAIEKAARLRHIVGG